MATNEDLNTLLESVATQLRAFKGRDKLPFSSAEDVAAKHGVNDSPEPFTDEELEVIASVVEGRVYKTRECYANAYHVVSDAKWMGIEGFEYAEGFGYSHALPIYIHHAVVLYNGKVIDLTWRADYAKGNSTRSAKKLIERIVENRESNVYRVVPVKFKTLMEHLRETYSYTPILDRMVVEGIPDD